MQTGRIELPVKRYARLDVGTGEPVPVTVIQEAPSEAGYAIIVMPDGQVGTVCPQFLKP